MVLHAGLSSEEVSVAATGTDVLNLMVYAYSNSWLNEHRFLDTRMTNVLVLKQFSRILVNDICPGIIDLFFDFYIRRGLCLKHLMKSGLVRINCPCLCMTVSD